MRRHATISLISIMASVGVLALCGVASAATEQPAAVTASASASSSASGKVVDKKTEGTTDTKVAANDAAEKKDAAKPAAADAAKPAADAAKPATNSPKADVISAQDDSVVQTITVTARRRKEMLKDIPGATQVITGDETEKYGIDSTRELLEQIPGAAAGLSGADYNDDIEMRGQGSGRNNLPIGSVSETSTALYQDGAYVAGGNFNGRQLSEMNFFDLSRVEILMGPQGALYGRNAVGGAFNVVTHKPDSNFSAKEKFTYGTNETYNTDINLNVPLDETDGIAARLGYFAHNQESGFVKNLTTGNWLDWKHSQGARAGVQVAPNDEFKIYGAFEYYHQNSPAYAQYGYEPNVDTNGGGRDPYVRNNLNSEGRTTTQQMTHYLGIDKTTSIGDLSLKLYRKSNDGVMKDNDYDHFVTLPACITLLPSACPGGVPPTLNGATIDQRQSVAENYLAYDSELTLDSNTKGRLTWQLGLEGLGQTDYQHTYFGECPTAGTFDSSNKLTAAALNATQGCSPGFVKNASYLSTNYFEMAAARVLMTDQQNTEHLSSYAAYGTASYKLTNKLTAGVEYRFQEDMKSLDYQKYNVDPNTYYGNNGSQTTANLYNTTGLAYVPTIAISSYYTFYCPPYLSNCGYAASTSLLNPHGALLPTFERHLDARWRIMLPAFTLKYDINPQNMVYYRWATGYRPGGFNSPNVVDVDVPNIYKPERTAGHEIGWKGRIFRNIGVTADAYYQTTRDVQMTEYDSSQGAFYLLNVGNAYSYGVESSINSRFKFGRGLMITSLGLSSNYGRYYDAATINVTHYNTGGGTTATAVDLSGHRLPHTRNIQGAYNLDYLFRLPWALGADLGGSWNFASGGNEDAASWRRYNGYGTLNLRAGLISMKGILLTASVKNVLDRRYEMYSLIGNDNNGQIQYWSSPTSVSLTLTLLQ